MMSAAVGTGAVATRAAESRPNSLKAAISGKGFDPSGVSADDTAIAAHIWPPLTTVRWPIISMARSAALKLVGDVIDPGSDVDEPSMFTSTLVRRASVAPPRGG